MKKVVLITGASRGIGKATAIEFAKKGYNVVINYVSNDDAAKNLKKYLTENYDTDVMTYKCDVSNEAKVKEMVKQVIDYFGKIDVLVNNAGIAIDVAFEDKTVENFRKTLDVNLIGPFIVSREVGKYMLEQKRGSIVNVSSDDAYESYYEFSLDYDASKAGLINLTHNLSKYFAPYIRVNAVAPGWIETEMNSLLDKEQMNEIENKYYLRRLGRSEEVAKAIYFLASDDASYINNEVLRVDGGANHQ